MENHLINMIYYEDKVYKIIRTMPKHNEYGRGIEYIKLWHDYLGVDKTLQNATHYLFCNEIPDAEIIEDDLIETVEENAES
jgi:hypothetical protein